MRIRSTHTYYVCVLRTTSLEVIMKKLFVSIVMLALVGVFAVAGCVAPGAANPTPEPTLSAVEPAGQIVAEARVVPARSADLSLTAGGMVAEVLVAEGDRVEAGQVLMRLDAARARAAAGRTDAALLRAQAYLADLKAGPRPQEIATAEAALAAAQAALEKLREGPDENQVIAARAEAANAEAALQQAQAAYDKVNAYPGASASPQALQLQQATNIYQAAQAHLDVLLKGPRAGDLAVAQAEIQRAQAQLDLVKAGPRPQTVAAAEAEVAAAQAGVEEAKAALAETELCAPFAGTVATLEIKAGEMASPGVPLVRLADLSAWEIESDDVTELDVINVHEGAPVAITFDALPGVELTGKVTRISAFGANKQGDIVYTVIIQLDRQDERLRWNMTASVTIQAK